MTYIVPHYVLRSTNIPAYRHPKYKNGAGIPDYIRNTDEKSISVDGFKHLAERIRYLKNDEKGVNYMCALMEQERVEGRIEERKELIMDFLNDIGKVSDGLNQKVLQETDFGILGRWVHLAAKAESISAFEREM